MKDSKIYYAKDIPHLTKEKEEKEVVELSPGVNVELDGSGQLIGVEVLKASCLLKDVIKMMEKRLHPA